MDLSQRLRLWADELYAIANEGLHWSSDNPYNMRRFARVRRLAAELFATQDTRDADQVEQLYIENPTHYAPYPCGDAAVFNQHGKILLIQRTDNKLWAMPGGAFEVGEAPAEAACRECWEETGVAVEPQLLIGVYDSRLSGSQTKAHLYLFTFLCRPLDPDAQPALSNETLDVGWFAENALPPLSPGHVRRVPDAFRAYQATTWQAVFDRIDPTDHQRGSL